jgi:PilZ domain
MRNQRKAARTRTYLGGKITFNQRSSVMDCLVRNFSSEGAKLAFTHTLAVPDEFELSIPKQQQTFVVRIVWRQKDEAGVVICGGAPARGPAPIPLDLLHKFKTYEAQNAALKMRVQQLCSAE